ncbi:MAG: F0F1 ATP synthase subunit B [Minisyncoccota bacterium]
MQEIAATFGIKWQLLMFQALNFAVVLWILQRFLYRPLLKIISERETHVKKGIKDAERAARELHGAQEERRRILSEASREAEAVLARAQEAAEDERATAVKQAEAESAALLMRAEVRAREQATQTILESREEIARMAVLAAERVLQKKLS